MKRTILLLLILSFFLMPLMAFPTKSAVNTVLEQIPGASAFEGKETKDSGNVIYTDPQKNFVQIWVPTPIATTQTKEASEETPPQTLAATVISKPINKFFRSGIFFDAQAFTTLVRKSQMSLGGALSFGLRLGETLMSVYGRADYILDPLGSSSGRLAVREVKLEPGVSFSFVVQSSQIQETRFTLDLGYYMQYVEYVYDANALFLVKNGLMVRPGLAIKFSLGAFLPLEMGIYYQFAAYPRYSDYDGLGVYLKLF